VRDGRARIAKWPRAIEFGKIGATMAEPNTPPLRSLPLLPLRDIILFPHMVVPLFVGRDRSIAALEAAMAGDKELLLVAQRNAKVNEPAPEDIYEVGTLGSIIQLLRMPGGTVKVLVEGKRRVRLDGYLPEERFFQVNVREIDEPDDPTVECEALMRSLKTAFEVYLKLNKRIPAEMLVSVQTIPEPSRLADTIAAQLQLKLADKQLLVETISPAKRMEKLYELMQAEVEILQVEKRIRSRVKRQMERSQKEYYLNEQMQAIQKELGHRDEFKSELAELEEKIAKKRMSQEAVDKLDKELRKLKMMAPLSAEATVVRNYVDWVLALPWDAKTEVQLDVHKAEEILEADHYGLQKVKERILEYLAVQSLVEKMKGPILCFVGPPGVGKTSLGRSIARATGRAFVRLSLGGVRDEAEIRGHRRTYIGALPGKIVQYMKKAGSSNPVFLLDEVDKMSTDFRGDPSSALLEVLDPEQNHAFNDHYLELDYDLSDVMFITTANNLHGIPLPLQDRMEIIRLPGYTEEEKRQIARRYLIPKQREANGLAECDLRILDRTVLTIIRGYTKEAGVRNLERELASVCRKIARSVVGQGKPPSFRVTPAQVEKYLGPPKCHDPVKEEVDEVGLANGLAVTQHGGELLATEVSVMPGKGKLVLTGKLGDVMKESAQAALTYVRTRAASFGLDPQFYQKVDLHVHLPEGAIPKDGPSAGITIVTAMVSALMHVPVRKDVAMTGEITLRGRVLAVGGLKEKILAAGRYAIRRVIVPSENAKDLEEVPPTVLKSVEICKVPHVDEVLRLALALPEPEKFLPQPSEAIDWRSAEAGTPVSQH
jgi:ATP-dependent Lon protease